MPSCLSLTINIHSRIGLLNSYNFFNVVALDGQCGAIPLGIKLPRDNSLLGEVVAQKCPIIVNDAFKSDFIDMIKLRESGSAFMNAPLISGGQVIGTLNSMRREAGSYAESEKELILQVAGLLASNIEGRRLFERVQTNLIQTENYARRQNLLNQMAKQLELANSQSEIFETLTRQINEFLPASLVSITLSKTDTAEYKIFEEINGNSEVFVLAPQKLKGTLVEQVISERRIINTSHLKDGEAQELLILSFSPGIDLPACLCTPLSIEEKIIGAITIANNDTNSYSVEDEILFLHIASFVAITLDNIQKSSELFHRAQELVVKNETLTRTIQMLDQQAVELRKTLEDNKEILGITAHDLKNPLGGVIGLADLILNDLEASESLELTEARENTVLIRKEAHRMLSIIEDLLDRHREEYVNVKNFDSVDLDHCVRTAIRWNSSQAQAKKMEIVYAGQSNAFVRINEIAIERAIDNLISNAVKYSWPGSTILISLEKWTEEGHKWRLSVADEGPGLTLDDRKKAFGKMNRLSAKPTGGEHSSGLGLYIVKQLIEQHGGSIGVESEPGKGATFWFTLDAL